MVKLFVGGFPLDSSEMDLVQLFSAYGDVSTIKIVRDKKTGTCKGYAFLEMTDVEGANKAIEALSGYPYGGERILTINLVKEQPEFQENTSDFDGQPNFATKYVKVEKPAGELKDKRQRKRL